MSIVYFPNEVLTQPCEEVSEFDDTLGRLVDEMSIEMYASRGVGLAAPQLGISKRVFVMDVTSGEKNDALRVFVNPRITWLSKELVILREGCLSMPGTMVSLERPECIEIEFQDVEGTKHTADFAGWESRIAQHETDHLDGISMFDRADKKMRKLLTCLYRPKKKYNRRKT